jgi:hypothetical protein
MISSEVQRTLVKSPPELWAEISDPAALARHLGEFGEIRITRVEPEQRVEWEAGDTSGSVVIKPSGWGTKVKLTVTREPAEVAGEVPQAPAAAGPAEPEAEWSDEDKPSSDAPIGASQTDEPVRASGDDQAFVDDEAAPQVDGSALLEDESAPLDEPALLQDEPALLDEQALLEDEHDLEDEPSLAPGAGDRAVPEARRGFFARLFGRRRGRAAIERLAAPDGAPEQMPEIARQRAAAPYNALAVWASQMDPTDGVDDEPAEALPAVQYAQDDAAQMPLDASRAIGAEAPPAPVDEMAPQPRAEPAEALDACEATIAGGACDDAAEDAQRADVAPDAEASEEAATEQVTAVLTGVLDRLGAAHHRPFSRA